MRYFWIPYKITRNIIITYISLTNTVLHLSKNSIQHQCIDIRESSKPIRGSKDNLISPEQKQQLST